MTPPVLLKFAVLVLFLLLFQHLFHHLPFLVAAEVLSLSFQAVKVRLQVPVQVPCSIPGTLQALARAAQPVR